ncbi:hypothetical protein ASJ33_04590 [Dehalococcoides mccartyi]|jgi:hypothetical protein|nr:hypothetical protein GY50_0795 [Dehalococcoides mccartyi GY50]AII57961.1 hypothetical protein X792_04135 [Dehalococcoides mccartyi CG1]APH12477.1 hypothetical protein ASJ33_04590 [Dehalococcoides mccartyi]
MGIIYHNKPEMKSPIMLAAWPGIGNVGIVTLATLRDHLGAGVLADIEPEEFFYPAGVSIKNGVQQELRFPLSRFYYQQWCGQDVIIFMGDEQPADGQNTYAQGSRAHRMANRVLDVAEELGCQRIITFGAAVTMTHHKIKPKVWTVANNKNFLGMIQERLPEELKSNLAGKNFVTNISGLNGLLLGVAQKRKISAACLMGEIPDYLSHLPLVYPHASRSSLEALRYVIRISVDLFRMDESVREIDEMIADMYSRFPELVRQKLDNRYHQSENQGISDDDEKWLKENINEFFKKDHNQNEHGS